MTGFEFEQRHDQHERTELVAGEIVALPVGNTPAHAVVTAHLGAFLLARLPGFHVLSGAGLHTAPDTVRAPDLVVISDARLRTADRAHVFLRIVPELVVEIRDSRFEATTDLPKRAAEYIGIGAVAWSVDVRERTIANASLAGSNVFTGERLVPLPTGDAVSVAELLGPQEL